MEWIPVGCKCLLAFELPYIRQINQVKNVVKYLNYLQEQGWEGSSIQIGTDTCTENKSNC